MRYFIGFIVTIGLIIILIVMLAGGNDKKVEVPKTNKTLFSYANSDAEVRLTAVGPINYDGSHRQVQIIASKNTIIYNQINGYEGQVAKGQSFANNQTAYTEFLYALYRSGFTMGETSEALKDERGFCPQGNRYVFELIEQGKSLSRFWSTSCGKPKTLTGSSAVIIDLFQAQVPGYNDSDSDYRFF